jgi:hypothetical protein
MPESNVIRFADFASRRRRFDRGRLEVRDKPYAGGGIDELWVGERDSAVIIPLR